MGQPLVLVGANASNVSKYEEVCTAITNGCNSGGPLPETIRGFIIGSIAPDVLASVVRDTNTTASWPCRMLWLEDGGNGFGNIDAAETTGGNEPRPRLDAIDARFRSALAAGCVQRLSYRDHIAGDAPCMSAKFQHGWIAFLRGKEALFPGITGIARRLFPTLLFGLTKLLAAYKQPEDFRWYIDDVAALSRVLVTRMLSSRSSLLDTARQARLRELAVTLARKLQDGPQKARDLSRRCHRIGAGECLEVLGLLHGAGVVECNGDRLWCLVVPTAEIGSKLQHFNTINV